MTQKEKELVIKDLCARLPYGVIVQVNDGLKGIIYDRRLVQIFCDRISCSVNVCNPLKECICIDSIKPYLRPLSSMTDEEREDFRLLGGIISYNPNHNTYSISAFSPEAYDWLNKKMFDYRGLIEKGLALEAPEGMYDN